MSQLPLVRRRACLGLAMGFAADLAYPRGIASRVTESSGTPLQIRYRTIHNFSGPDGAHPMAGLIVGSDGLAYGTTSEGGLYRAGTVYRLTHDRRIKVLHSFAGRPHDGLAPESAVVQGRDGALYGVTAHGGHVKEEDGGVIYRLAPGSGYAILHEFGRTATGGDLSVAGLTLASDGNFYGATVYGGDDDYGLVYRIAADGSFTPIWSLPANPEPANPYAAPIEGADGRLYGTSLNGGSSGLGTVYSLLKDGGDPRVLHSLSYEEGARPVAGVTQGSDGALYGTASTYGPRDAGTAYRLTLDGKFEVLHAFGPDIDGDDPSSALTEIQPGVFAGTTTAAGAFYRGTAFMMSRDGRYRLLHSFGGDVHDAPDGWQPFCTLLAVGPGHILGTCKFGGLYGRGTIWSMQVVPA